MKHLFVLIGITAGMTTSLLAQAPSNKAHRAMTPKEIARARQNAAIARAVREKRSVYYISNETTVGSFIPQVSRQYDGRRETTGSFATPRVYGADDVGLTGSLNVGSAIRTLDPATR